MISVQSKIAVPAKQVLNDVKTKYVFKVGKQLVDADKYVRDVDLAIFQDYSKNPAQYTKMYNFAARQYYNFRRDEYFKALNDAILSGAPKQEIDKLAALLEEFTSKNFYSVL